MKPAFIIASLLILLLTYSDTLKRYLLVPPARSYNGTEFYSDDYSIYAGIIKYGMKGGWGWYDLHTTEPHQPALIHVIYSAWGHISKFFGIQDAGVSYHLLRLVSSLFLLASIYYLISSFLPRKLQFIAWILILFATGFPKIASIPSGHEYQLIYGWLTETNPFYRLAALPHYVLGNSFFVLALAFFLKHLEYLRRNRKLSFLYLVLICISTVLIALIHPVSLAVFYVLIASFSVLHFLLHLPKTPTILFSNLASLFPLLVSAILSLPIALYFKHLLSLPPWIHMAEWEKGTYYGFIWYEFLLAQGPLLFLAPIGLLSALKTKETQILGLLSTLWVIINITLSLRPYTGDISNVRFLQSFTFIPLGILGAFALSEIVGMIKKLTRINTVLVGIILSLLGLLISVPVFRYSLNYKLNLYNFQDDLAFPYNEFTQSYSWLDTHTTPSNVVLCHPSCGHLLPFSSGNTVYIGHNWATLDRKQKEALLNRFFSGQMTIPEADTFLASNRVHYVHYSYLEQSLGSIAPYLDRLEPVFQNSSVLIYKVRQ